MSNVDVVTGQIIDASFRIHRGLGPGLLESVYEVLLAASLRKRGLTVETQKECDLFFDGLQLKAACRVDMLVESTVIVELKSVEKFAAVHSKQLLTYLRVTNLQVGLLLNFGAPTMLEGIKRIVNEYEGPPSSAEPLPQP
jgi:GxxExxY protein